MYWLNMFVVGVVWNVCLTRLHLFTKYVSVQALHRQHLLATPPFPFGRPPSMCSSATSLLRIRQVSMLPRIPWSIQKGMKWRQMELDPSNNMRRGLTARGWQALAIYLLVECIQSFCAYTSCQSTCVTN